MTNTAFHNDGVDGTGVSQPSLRAILQWLESPLAHHPAEDLPALRAHLTVLRNSAATPQQRAVVVDGLYRRNSAVLERVLPSLSEVPLPVPPKTRRIVRSVLDLLQMLADETLSLGEGLMQRNPTDFRLSPDLALWRSLDSMARQLLISHLIAAPARTGAWQQLHQTYALAQRLNLGAAVPRGAPSSLHHVYRMAVLMGCAQPASLTPGEVFFLAEYLARFGDYVEPLTSNLATAPGAFWIDPNRDVPALSVSRKVAAPSMPLESFSCNDLTRLVRSQLAELDAGTPPKRLKLPDFAATPAGRGVLQRLAERWSGSGKRRFQRRKQHSRTLMGAGLGDLWQLCTKREGASVELSTWMITNESPQGYAVMHVSGKTKDLSVGGIAAVRMEAAKDWQICIVRWAVSENPEHLELGLQVLAPTAIPAILAQPSESKGTEHLRALILPEIPNFRSTQLLVVPAGTVPRRQQKLLLVIEGENLVVREVHSIGIDEQTASVEILSIGTEQDTV